jgi:integrase
MKDRKVSTGIYRTKYGWRIFVRVDGTLRPKRIKDPFHHIGLVDLKRQRDDWRTDARRLAGAPPPSTPGTFAEDVRLRYLPAVKARVNLRERTYHMELWVAEFGERPTTSIEPWEIAKVRDRWLTEGPVRVCVKWDPNDERPEGARSGKWIDVAKPLSASQVNKRLRALENFFTVLHGRHAPNPVREAGEAREPEALPRAIAYDVVEAIIGAMPDRGRPTNGVRDDVSLTKLRLRVIAYTGFSHGELMGIAAEHLHLDDPQPWVWIGGRQKGRGTEGTAQPLTKKGARALKALVKADGLGTFSPDSMRKSFVRACAKLDLEGLTPYDLRHSYASEILEKTGGNIGATQLAMRHKDARTTLHYGKRAIDPVRLATIQQVQARGGFKARR